MTTNEIEQLAAKNIDIPAELDMGEQLLFITLRTLYQNFKTGKVSRERGAKEKQEILNAYKNIRLECDTMKFYQQINTRVARSLEELYKCGCPNCKHLIELFSGIDRNDIPEDLKAANEQIVKLRSALEGKKELLHKVCNALTKNEVEKAKLLIKNGGKANV